MNNSIELLKIELELDYTERKSRYDMECELLRLQREQFYRDNPDAPPYMYMQVTAPPKRIEINLSNMKKLRSKIDYKEATPKSFDRIKQTAEEIIKWVNNE